MGAEEIRRFYVKHKADSGKVQKALPEMVRAFGGLFQSVMKAGALGVKEKELIAMAIGLTTRCHPCIYLHVQKCLDAGATREEILEAASVVVMMQGGPGYVYFPQVMDALEALGK